LQSLKYLKQLWVLLIALQIMDNNWRFSGSFIRIIYENEYYYETANVTFLPLPMRRNMFSRFITDPWLIEYERRLLVSILVIDI